MQAHSQVKIQGQVSKNSSNFEPMVYEYIPKKCCSLHRSSECGHYNYNYSKRRSYRSCKSDLVTGTLRNREKQGAMPLAMPPPPPPSNRAHLLFLCTNILNSVLLISYANDIIMTRIEVMQLTSHIM